MFVHKIVCHKIHSMHSGGAYLNVAWKHSYCVWPGVRDSSWAVAPGDAGPLRHFSIAPYKETDPWRIGHADVQSMQLPKKMHFYQRVIPASLSKRCICLWQHI